MAWHGTNGPETSLMYAFNSFRLNLCVADTVVDAEDSCELDEQGN